MYIFARHKQYIYSMYNHLTRTNLLWQTTPAPARSIFRTKSTTSSTPVRFVHCWSCIRRVVITTLRTRLARQLSNVQVAHKCHVPAYRTPYFRCGVAMRISECRASRCTTQASNEARKGAMYRFGSFPVDIAMNMEEIQHPPPPPLQEPLLVQTSLR